MGAFKSSKRVPQDPPRESRRPPKASQKRPKRGPRGPKRLPRGFTQGDRALRSAQEGSWEPSRPLKGSTRTSKSFISIKFRYFRPNVSTL